MARIRSVKPEFWTDEKIVDLSPWARLLFLGLLNFVDDEGRMIYSPKRIKMQIFPADDVDVPQLIGELRRKPAELFGNPRAKALVTIYTIDGVDYLQVGGFMKHQKIDKRSRSKHPAPLPETPTPAESPRALPLDQGRDQGGEGIKDHSDVRTSGAGAPISTDVEPGTPAAVPKPNGKTTAPKAATEDLLDIPLSMVIPEDGDWGKALFGPAMRWLMKRTGRKEAVTRGFIGKCLSTTKNDHRAVFRVLADAQKADAPTNLADITAWIAEKFKRPIAGARTLPRLDQQSAYQTAHQNWRDNGMQGPPPKLADFARASA